MVSKISVKNNNDIVITLNRASLFSLMNSMGLISKEAKKSADSSWRQYKRGESHLLVDAKDLLS